MATRRISLDAWWLTGVAALAGAAVGAAMLTPSRDAAESVVRPTSLSAAAASPLAPAADRLESSPPGAPQAARPRKVRFSRDIRPLLSDRCYQCHGPDAGTRMAGLRLDVREDAVAVRKDGGSPAIVPGDPSKSELWRRVSTTDAKEAMPPADSHKRALAPEEKEMFRAWIEQGAVYEPHWAFQAPVRPPVPGAGETGWGGGWPINEIDRFIFEALDAEGIAPSPDASRRALLRRVFLDLTGLPPTPEEIAAFLADKSEGAYEKVVDKLLTEEPYVSRYAERMTATWLDEARYADTSGIHMDAGRQSWLWRDWVLDAYRTNMPFDRFVIEQLAGDLIPNATLQQKVATGFNRNHVTTDEGGAISEEYLVEYAVDRATTTSSVLLGLTVGCARCHDHKFDPITMEDFYSIYSFFNSIEEPGLYSQVPDANRALEPFLAVPTAAQQTRLDDLNTQVTALRQKLDTRTPEEESARDGFLNELAARAGLGWADVKVTAAESTGGATMTIQPDGSVVATGTNPDKDEHILTLRTDATNLRLFCLEVLPEPTAFEGRVGRADNGNAVLGGFEVEAVSVRDPSVHQPVRLIWAWADHTQQNGDFNVSNILDPDERGWAVGAHNTPGGRAALVLADQPFGYEGGTELRVRLLYNTMYTHHVFAHVRVDVGSLSDAGAALLSTEQSRTYAVGPFPSEKDKVYETANGPEEGNVFDFSKEFGAKKLRWRFDENFRDGAPVGLPEGGTATYVGKYVYAPTPREVPLSLGSDDGFMLYVNGKLAAERRVDRGVQPDQDKATIHLEAGRNAVVMKIVNTGGPAGYYYSAADPAELTGDLAQGVLPASVRAAEAPRLRRFEEAWRRTFLPVYRETEAKIQSLTAELDTVNAMVPLTMVMKELAEPRKTYVLDRGQYDHPNMERPVNRRVPASLGKLADGAPANRLGLAQWMMDPANPLVARVTVNRMWETAFGTGLVKSSGDFGLQGDFPSHPELLDWLAVEFRESGWDVKHMMKLIVTSRTYRQSSTIRPELRESDPENRLLASFPRRRLAAEQIRDLALYTAGLLVEKLGGPSVKPYQPAGLWAEVAMPQSNTREFKRGGESDLWRRSIYTYWKRAAPPPSMLTFDAPTREFCTIKRAATSTPLQALVMWNDEQFVEASRVLAARTLQESKDDAQRLTNLFVRCAAREPSPSEMTRLTEALAYFRGRYAAAPADAEGLLMLGMARSPDDLPKDELAAWTMIASAVMNMYETTTQE